MEAEMDKIYADATKGDQTARQRARVLATEQFPNMSAADRERFYHAVEARLNAFRGP
jgi:hypothetical protein